MLKPGPCHQNLGSRGEPTALGPNRPGGATSLALHAIYEDGAHVSFGGPLPDQGHLNPAPTTQAANFLKPSIDNQPTSTLLYTNWSLDTQFFARALGDFSGLLGNTCHSSGYAGAVVPWSQTSRFML